MKKSFLLYIDSLIILDHLSDEQCGILFKAIRDYAKGEDIVLDTMLNIAFLPIRNQIDRDMEKYENICERNRENGSKGGRPSKPKKPNGLSGNPNKPKKAHNDTDTDNDTDKDNKECCELPNYVSKSTWRDVKAHRNKIKKPMTARAEKLLLKNFEEIHNAGMSVDDAVDMMVQKGWTSVSVEWMNNAIGKKQDRIQRSGFEHNDYRPEI